MAHDIWLVRHGETEWSLSGQHTGRTDIPLTDAGREHARSLPARLAGNDFPLVLSSPLQRALETCRLAGFGDRAVIDPDLAEWNYGAYEGRTSLDIRGDIPDWTIWTHPVPNGESIDEVAVRARRVIDRASGGAVLFAHGHILRIVAACWLGLDPRDGRLLALSTGSISVLGHERGTRVIERWNQT